MRNAMDEPLDHLVAAVIAGAHCRSVCPDLVRSIGARELSRRRSLKEAVKATKNKLHQAAGAYVTSHIDYGAHLAELRRAGDGAALAAACRHAMARHASSKERLPILHEFYAATLGLLPPVRSVLDVACGLNPLAIPWMPLAEGCTYYACDIYADMMAFVGEFLAVAGVRGEASVCDVLTHCPRRHVDVALLLKAIPCLEQIDPAAGARLLARIDADHLLVSFPVHSLGGRDKGMVVNYEARLHELVAERNWPVRRFEFATELAFLIDK